MTQTATISLAERAKRYCDETERVVRTIGEHPQFELKRALDLSNLRQRIEFVKDLQSIATSEIAFEKFLVIGADESTRQFVPVTNLQDFDEAKIRQQLERFLAPVPRFELFSLRTSEDVPFVLFVIGKQPTRRILARITVDDPAEQKPRTLLREGDLWTKGTSTGKHLARPEDWDAIYQETVEREAESRTRTRTDHVVAQVIAQERLRAVSGSLLALPAHMTDEEFKLVTEEICAHNDARRLSILIERLRDDLVEGWHKHQAHREGLFIESPDFLQEFRHNCRIYRDSVFHPAMQRLILLCIGIVKNRGSIELLDVGLELLRETYSMSDQLHALKDATPRNSRSRDIEDHLSHTTVALESLVAIYALGAYIVKRRRFEYFRPLLTKEVRPSGVDLDRQAKNCPIIMWPMLAIWGEPEALKYRAGRIDICTSKITHDATILNFFGDEDSARRALIELELLVEFNSFLAVETAFSPATVKYMQSKYPRTDFSFWPSLFAFDLHFIMGIAGHLFALFNSGTNPALSEFFMTRRRARF